MSLTSLNTGAATEDVAEDAVGKEGDTCVAYDHVSGQMAAKAAPHKHEHARAERDCGRLLAAPRCAGMPQVPRSPECGARTKVEKPERACKFGSAEDAPRIRLKSVVRRIAWP